MKSWIKINKIHHWNVYNFHHKTNHAYLNWIIINNTTSHFVINLLTTYVNIDVIESEIDYKIKMR